MSILQNLFAGESLPNSGDDFWFTDLSGRTMSGQYVNEATAMRVSAVYACVKVISETLASLPLQVYERLPDGGKQVARNHPLYDLLHTQPNNFQTSVEFREFQQAHITLTGDSYSEVISGQRGFVDQLIGIHPNRVKKILLDNGSHEWEIKDNERTRIIPAERMHHVMGLSLDGETGISPIGYLREQIGASLATTEHVSRFYKNDMNPGGVLTHPSHFKDQTAYERFAASWRKARTGKNRHSTAILEDGMKYEAITMNARDSQFIETQKFQVSDIARMFRVPPHMIGDLEKSTNNNIEHQGLEFVVHTMRPWLVKHEQAQSRDLLVNTKKYFTEFNVDGLLRGDQKSRYESYSKGITDGWLTRNEVRKMENRNPLKGLDEPLQQMNMSKVAEQSAKVVRKEIIAVSEAHDKRSEDREGFNSWAKEYYSKYRKFVRENIDTISKSTAEAYVQASLNEVLASDDIDSLMEEWEEKRSEQLNALIEKQTENAS